MNSTKPLQILHKFLAGYHEPAPLSAQQTQKLLETITTSFRKQLDLEYGSTSEPRVPAVAPSATGTAGHGKNSRRPWQSPARRHFDTILANPLFANRDEQPDPMIVYRQAIQKGMMTFKAATGVMIAKDRGLQGDPKALAASQMGSSVLAWLRNSGAEDSMTFLDHKDFMVMLTKFLVAEDMQHIIWDWIVRVREMDMSPKRRHHLSLLLTLLVRSQTGTLHGQVDSAMSTVQDAAKLLPADVAALVEPWKLTSWAATVKSSYRMPPSPSLLDAHIAMGQELPAPLAVPTAHLQLRHPTKSDDRPAMEIFQSSQELLNIMAEADSQTSTRQGGDTLRWLLFLGQDTLIHLLTNQRLKEASWLAKRMRKELNAPKLSPFLEGDGGSRTSIA